MIMVAGLDTFDFLIHSGNDEVQLVYDTLPHVLKPCSSVILMFFWFYSILLLCAFHLCVCFCTNGLSLPGTMEEASLQPLRFFGLAAAMCTFAM
jgi:hypothetical protein